MLRAGGGSGCRRSGAARSSGIERLHLDLVIRLQIELELVQFKDSDALDRLLVAELFDEGNCLLDRLKLVVSRVSIRILKNDHVLRHDRPLLVVERLAV